jgi:hypothetical protein
VSAIVQSGKEECRIRTVASFKCALWTDGCTNIADFRSYSCILGSDLGRRSHQPACQESRIHHGRQQQPRCAVVCCFRVIWTFRACFLRGVRRLGGDLFVAGLLWNGYNVGPKSRRRQIFTRPLLQDLCRLGCEKSTIVSCPIFETTFRSSKRPWGPPVRWIRRSV